ncbi:hypothetical protein [Pseudoroseomonas cervicalis]|uniref:phage tail terminator protein n=1 Tax=Teichococcus cervicalis TaxID=204525 RepID=UPI00277F1A42|nr:hypothetical protein [Pseudoroseomonas cervicalis]MDQ1078007.1 hypothetical protein [Pseudoroseomonas cervicalis]
MRPSLIIPRLREMCPIFEGRVAGAAEYPAAVDDSGGMKVPHAFVIPLGDSATGEVQISALDIELEVPFAVAVCVSNLADERGQAGVEAVWDIRAQLLRALVGWQPAEGMGTILYRGMPDNPALTRSRMWMQFDFHALEYTASAA